VGEGVAKPGEFAGHVAAGAVERFLARGEGGNLFFGEASVEGVGGFLGTAGDGLFHVLADGDAGKDAANDVVHLVGAEFLADFLHFVEEGLEDFAFAGLGRDKVKNDNRVVLLEIAMDAAHALLEAGGVPRDVIVDHDPAELEIDALAGGVGGDEKAGAAFAGGFAEVLDLFFALGIVHPAVNLRDLAGIAHALKAAHKEGEGVPVLGEDDEFLVGVFGGGEEVAELLVF
jgi:hypothetical protein